jgi:hypothetical protein
MTASGWRTLLVAAVLGFVVFTIWVDHHSSTQRWKRDFDRSVSSSDSDSGFWNWSANSASDDESESSADDDAGGSGDDGD